MSILAAETLKWLNREKSRLHPELAAKQRALAIAKETQDAILEIARRLLGKNRFHAKVTCTMENRYYLKLWGSRGGCRWFPVFNDMKIEMEGTQDEILHAAAEFFYLEQQGK